MNIEVNITELKVGHYVVSIANQENNFSLTSSGHIKNQSIIDMLESKGVQTLLIDPNKTVVQAIASEPKSRDSIARGIKKAHAVFEQSKAIQQKVFTDALNGVEIDLGPIVDITNQTIDTVFDVPDAIACVVNIREKDAYLLEHSVAVSVYISLFARHMALPKHIIEQLAIGAFLHDVGKIMIPDKILNKPGRLTEEEFEVMKSHAAHSIDIIKKTPDVSPLSLEVAALHHEKINGNGYPNQVKGDDISLYGRMIAICDIFDALTANRVYKDGFTHHKAFVILRELVKDNHLDNKLVEEFIRCIGAFPVGSLVKLHSNKLAIVERPNSKDPTKPAVRSFYSVKHKHFVETKDIDLSKSQDFIEKAVRADDFDLDIKKITELLLMAG